MVVITEGLGVWCVNAIIKFCEIVQNHQSDVVRVVYLIVLVIL